MLDQGVTVKVTVVVRITALPFPRVPVSTML
jgi:hypothetical protein